MVWNDPSLAAYVGQPASQAPMGGESGLDSLQRQLPWDAFPVTGFPMDVKSRVAMAGPTSQNAFISSMPAMSDMSSCGTLVTTTWASDGTLLTHMAPRLGSDSCTSQEFNPQAPRASGSNSSKSNQYHASSDMNNAVEGIQQGIIAAPLPKELPGRTKESPAGVEGRDEGIQMTLDTDMTYSGRTPWLGDTKSVTSDDDSSRRGTKPQDCNDQRNNNNNGCSPTQPRPIQAHRARNRRAATKCRAKAKAAKAELEDAEREMETRHQELSAQASSLQNEVLALKNELLMHGNCDCEVIQQYLSNAAKNIIDCGMI